MRNRYLHILGVFIYLMALFTFTVQAQNPASVQLFVKFDKGHITLYSWSGNEIELLESATLVIQAETYPQTSLSIFDTAVSPDGTRVAFMGYAYDETEKAALLVYSLPDDSLEKIALPGLGQLQWAPDNQHILIVPNTSVYDVRNRIEDIYCYDVRQGSLYQVTYTPDEGVETEVTWVPGTDTIVFVGPLIYESCDLICLNSNNLYAIQSDGSNLVQLTDLASQIPLVTEGGIQYGLCKPIKVHWSSLDNRIRYVVSCDDRWVEFLYSVSLKGENRLEADLRYQFPDGFQLRIQSIHDDLLHEKILFTATASPMTGKTPLRIYALSENTVEIIIDEETGMGMGAGFTYAILRSDSRALAVSTINEGTSGNGMIRVFDLEEKLLLAKRETPLYVCNMNWLDSDTLIYDQLDYGSCGGSDSLWKWHITEDVIESIRDPLLGRIQIGYSR